MSGNNGRKSNKKASILKILEKPSLFFPIPNALMIVV